MNLDGEEAERALAYASEKYGHASQRGGEVSLYVVMEGESPYLGGGSSTRESIRAFESLEDAKRSLRGARSRGATSIAVYDFNHHLVSCSDWSKE